LGGGGGMVLWWWEQQWQGCLAGVLYVSRAWELGPAVVVQAGKAGCLLARVALLAGVT
jgi:hypothetical protein